MVTPGNQSKRGNPNIKDIGVETRFQPGQSGNPKGAPKARVIIWKYVQTFSEMTEGEFELIDESKLTMSQLSAKDFVFKMRAGSVWHIKEALDRDEGPISKDRDQSDPLSLTDALGFIRSLGLRPLNPLYDDIIDIPQSEVKALPESDEPNPVDVKEL